MQYDPKQQQALHLARVGRDDTETSAIIRADLFQSTRPGWGGTLSARLYASACIFQSTRPGGAGLPGRQGADLPVQFQSTRPGWGGTRYRKARVQRRLYFNPPAPGGAGLPAVLIGGKVEDFNPPAPGGAGPGASIRPAAGGRFQSTRPGWGGTVRTFRINLVTRISIHPPRVGRDRKCGRHRDDQIYFNPPAPGGAGRGAASSPRCHLHDFNPPAPGGAGRHPGAGIHPAKSISIHPPRVGRDQEGISFGSLDEHFNPPAPGGAGRKTRRRRSI